MQGATHIKEELERAKLELETAHRASDLTRMSELQYGRIPELEKQLAEAMRAENQETILLRNNVTEEEVAEIVSKWTGIPVAKMLEGEKDKLLHMEERAGRTRRRPAGSRHGGLERDPPLARRPVGSETSDRFVPVPRSHRRRQDRAHQGARELHVRYGRRDGAPRHVGVHGEAFGRAAHRRAAGLRRLRGRRLPDGSRAAASLFGDPARRGREGTPGRVQCAAAGSGRRPPHGRAGPHGRLPQYRDRHDLEPRLATDSGDVRRRELRPDEVRAHGCGRHALPARIHQPGRRRGRVPPACRRNTSAGSWTSSSDTCTIGSPNAT